MCRLSEKYAPKTLGEVVGQPETVNALKRFVQRPEASGWLFVGGPGCGKSSIVRALQNELGIDQWSTYRYAGPDLDLAATKDLFAKLRFRPMSGRFNLVIIEEFERCASDQVRTMLKDRLGEGQWPSSLIVLITSNDISKLEPALLERFQVCHLRSDMDFGVLVLPRLQQIYAKECEDREVKALAKGLCNGARLYSGGVVRDLLDGSRYSMRAALSAIERLFAYC